MVVSRKDNNTYKSDDWGIGLSKSMDRIILDIGCGDAKTKNTIGIDIRRATNVDIVADASSLPFKGQTVEGIISNHLIEHISHKEIGNVISEWSRILKYGAPIQISCPDLRARSLLFFLNPTWENVVHIYGEQNHEGNFHKCGFSFGLLKGILESCNFENVTRIIDGYKGIPFLPSSLRVHARKARD